MPDSEPASPRILILGGTAEARALADALACSGYRVVTSLAGRTQFPLLPAGEVRSGGFGGPEGLAAYLRDEGIDALVNATHPFAAQISLHASMAAGTSAVPLLRIERPAWQQQPGDRWVLVPTLEAAAGTAARLGCRAFLTVGAGELSAFESVTGIWFLVRLVDRPEQRLPLWNYELLLARGPFHAEAEAALLLAHRIDLVISKNSGGAATYGKIEAARRLGIPVLMVDRPAPMRAGAAATAPDVAGALRWIALTLPASAGRRDAGDGGAADRTGGCR